MAYNPTSGPQRLFVLAGMPRAGTTYAYHAFATHPDAFVPFRKELRYFSLNYHRGNDWYSHFFARAAPSLVCVDTSPDYFMDTDAPARLSEFSPTIKVALAVRNPAAWAVSLHRHLGTIESGVPKFSDFLANAEYPDFAFPWFRRKPKLQLSLQKGFVRSQLITFRDALGDRLLLYDFDWFERDPLGVMQTLESFLGLRSFFSKRNLPGGRINARERNNTRWVNYLSSRDALINMAGTVIPRKLLVTLRMRMDRACLPISTPARQAEDTTNLARAQCAFASDLAYIDLLFSASPVVLGNGLPYSPVQLSRRNS